MPFQALPLKRLDFPSRPGQGSLGQVYSWAKRTEGEGRAGGPRLSVSPPLRGNGPRVCVCLAPLRVPGVRSGGGVGVEAEARAGITVYHIQL